LCLQGLSYEGGTTLFLIISNQILMIALVCNRAHDFGCLPDKLAVLSK